MHIILKPRLTPQESRQLVELLQSATATSRRSRSYHPVHLVLDLLETTVRRLVDWVADRLSGWVKRIKQALSRQPVVVAD